MRNRARCHASVCECAHSHLGRPSSWFNRCNPQKRKSNLGAFLTATFLQRIDTKDKYGEVLTTAAHRAIASSFRQVTIDSIPFGSTMEAPLHEAFIEDGWVNEITERLGQHRERAQTLLRTRRDRLRGAEDSLSQQVEELSQYLAHAHDQITERERELDEQSRQLARRSESIDEQLAQLNLVKQHLDEQQ